MINLELLMANPNFILILVILLIWDVIWKGIALWTSARNKQSIWFFFLLIVNSLGILPIIYLLFFRKGRK